MIRCPHCKSDFADNPSLAGQMVRCPTCGGTFGIAGNIPEHGDTGGMEPTPPPIQNWKPSPVKGANPAKKRTILLVLACAGFACAVAVIAGLQFAWNKSSTPVAKKFLSRASAAITGVDHFKSIALSADKSPPASWVARTNEWLAAYKKEQAAAAVEAAASLKPAEEAKAERIEAAKASGLRLPGDEAINPVGDYDGPYVNPFGTAPEKTYFGGGPFYVTAVNRGNTPIAQITFEFRAMQPGRVVPLTTKIFTWNISGGLESGEQKETMFLFNGDILALYEDGFVKENRLEARAILLVGPNGKIVAKREPLN